MAVTLRSGREFENRKTYEKRKTEEEKQVEEEEEIKMGSLEKTEESIKKKVQQEQPVEERNLKKRKEVQAYMPYVPFPQRQQRARMEERFSKFLDMLKQIEINIPFVEALAQMPNYAKFLKDIMSNSEEGVVSLTTTYSAVIHKNLSLKM